MGELAIGDLVDGRYALEKPLADEFLGRVWWARDRRRDRPVRLKWMRPDHLTDDQRFRRSQREIEAFGRVRSPGVLELLDTGVHDSSAYAVFAPVPERTLADRVRGGPTPWRDAAKLLSVLVVGIGALHREGVVHRDLTAANVLVDDEGRPWIRDLGLSWLVSTEDDTGSLTDGEGRVGHLAVMAPEYLQQQTLSPAADLYALGVLSFELLTGAPPFSGTSNEFVRQTLGGVAPAPSSKVPGIPAWLDALVLQLLDKDPSRRPAPDAILARLQGGLAEAAPPTRRGRTAAVAGVVVALLVGGGGLAWAVGSGALARLTAPPPEQGLRATEQELPPPEPVLERWILPASGVRDAKVVPTAGEAEAVDRRVVEAGATAIVRSNQRALVSLDGVPVGFTPVRLHAAPGPHQLVVVLPGRADTRRAETVTFSDATDRELTVVF